MVEVPGALTAPLLCPPRLAARADLEGLRSWWQAGADLGRPGYDGRSALLVVSVCAALLGHLLQEGLPTLPPALPPPPLPPVPRLLLSVPTPGPSLGRAVGRHPGGREAGRGWGGGSGALLLVTGSLPQAEAAGNLEVVTFLQHVQGGAPVSFLCPTRDWGFPVRPDPGLGPACKGQSRGRSQRPDGSQRVRPAELPPLGQMKMPGGSSQEGLPGGRVNSHLLHAVRSGHSVTHPPTALEGPSQEVP